ncbi:hypothetical protein LIA77_02307 [Sarocladium implicatum]|nr:hypothetical protein LIA77_02307 [Sarocladium implicatum]
MASQQQQYQQLRRRCSSAADRAPVEPLSGPEATTTTLSSSEHSTPAVAHEEPTMETQNVLCSTGVDAEAMPPPPLPSAPSSPTRQSRSTSTASRNANRLSLTLPIALPTSDPLRPTPTSAVSSSVPPTPVESPATKQPSGTNEFIIAVAAQERRVLELREELARAEADLITLKKQWTAQEAAQKRASLRQLDLSRTSTPTQDDEPRSARLSADLERRRSLLLNQNTPTHTPGRRRVLRGGHTRTLSLLSPPKSDGGFAVHEDREHEILKLPPAELRTAQLTNPTLSKRSSWQPRMHHHQSQQSQSGGHAMPQLVEDFRLGFQAFVEDIRQITVGEEPISGQAVRSPGAAGNTGVDDANDKTPKDHDTIRPPQPTRPDVMKTFDLAGSLTATPTPPTRTRDMSREKVKPAKNKRFSWTPLGFDSMDDSDWSNWESPASTKSARWSGSTVNSSLAEETPSIPEKEEEASPSRKSDVDMPLSPAKLKEMLPSMVNGFSPSNIKRTATTLMTEWEKSLITPEDRDKENTM